VRWVEGDFWRIPEKRVSHIEEGEFQEIPVRRILTSTEKLMLIRHLQAAAILFP
jgi:hypothetical protein